MSNKFWKSFKTTKYSKDKEFLNAVVISDVAYKLINKITYKLYRILMYLYALVIFIVTGVSLLILAFSRSVQLDNSALFSVIEAIVFVVLIVDVLLRWYTAEVRIKKGNLSYLLFPITISGILLIVSLLPSLYLINLWTGNNIEIFNVFEHMKFLRIFRIILLANLIPGLAIFKSVLVKEKSVLYVIFGIVLITILLFALVIFNIETSAAAQEIMDQKEQLPPNVHAQLSISNFLDALYFSTVALTTIGFGDIAPITNTGKIVVMIMSIIGIAILAAPAGVITGGFISEIRSSKAKKQTTK